MVYPTEDGHPSKCSPGPMLINFVDLTNAANHYTTPLYICLSCLCEFCELYCSDACSVYCVYAVVHLFVLFEQQLDGILNRFNVSHVIG